MDKWQPMDSAPRDGTTILAMCDHDADRYYAGEGRLTTYGGHCEDLGYRSGKTVCVVCWGGGYTETSDYDGSAIVMPDWWFDAHSEFEVPVNPVAWLPIPEWSRE